MKFVLSLVLIAASCAAASAQQNDMPMAPTAMPAQHSGMQMDAQMQMGPQMPMHMPMQGAPAPPSHNAAQPPPTAAAPDLLDAVMHREPIPLSQFLAWAAGDSPSIAAARDQVESSSQQGRQAGLYPNPTVGYSSDQLRGGSYGGGEQGGFVQQTVVLGGKLGLRRDLYRQQAQADRIAVDGEGVAVRARVERLFCEALAAQQMIVLRQQLLRVAQDAEATAHQLANVGQADTPDVLQAEAEAAQAAMDVADAERSYLATFAALATAAARPELPPSPLAGSLEDAPRLQPDKMIDTLVANSPDAQLARQQVRVAEAKLKDAQHESTPDLTLRAGERWSGEQLPGSAQPAGAMSFADASIDLPLWNRNQGGIAAASAEVARSRSQARQVELDIRAQAAPLAQQYLAARADAEQYRDEILPRAQKAHALYLAKYEQMASAYPQVLVSQRTLFQMQVRELEALENEWLAAIALQDFRLMRNGNEGLPSTETNLP